MKIRVAALITIVTSGCSTILTLEQGMEQDKQFDCTNGKSIPRVYSGTNNSIRVLGENPWYLSPLILIDTLLCIPGDFLLLGITIPTQISRGNMCFPVATTNEQSP